MIPKAAMEAAEQAIRKEMESQAYDRHTYTQAALEAAAPYLRAQALEDAADGLPSVIIQVFDGSYDINNDTRNWLRARAVTERGEG